MKPEESEFQYHTSCVSCGSTDGNSVYSDGHTHCFVCGAHTNSSEHAERKPYQKKVKNVQIKGTASSLPKRNIKSSTCEKFGCTHDGKLLRFYYKSRAGEVVGCKLKTVAKEFSWEGSNSDHQFFGQHLFPGGGKEIVIYEGELDAMSGYEARPTWPAVSLPNGAPSAKKAIQAQLEYLQGYESVVLFFDNDQAGQDAAIECAECLPPGKARIAKLSGEFKDASDALQAGKADAIRSAIWNATTFVPGGIISGKSLQGLVTESNPPCDQVYPYAGLNEILHGLRFGELITVTAGSGIGKSSFCREIATHLLENGVSVGYLALEESVRRTAQGLMSSKMGKAYHLKTFSEEELQEAYEQTLARWDLQLFDGFGSYDPNIIYNRIEYMALALDVKVVFLDHLSILLSGLDGDERRMIDTTMTRLRSLVERTGIGLFLVCHLSGSGEGGSYEEGGRVKLTNLRGSKSIGQLSDTVIALERDQQEDTLTTVRVLKNRFTGQVGPCCELSYDLETCRYKEIPKPELEFPPIPAEAEDF